MLGEGRAGEFVKAFLSAGMGLEEKIGLCAAGPWSPLGNASTSMSHLGSKWNQVARMTRFAFSTSFDCLNSSTPSSQHRYPRESGLDCQVVTNMTPASVSECSHRKLTPRKPREDAFLLTLVTQHAKEVAWQGLLGNIKKPI